VEKKPVAVQDGKGAAETSKAAPEKTTVQAQPMKTEPGQLKPLSNGPGLSANPVSSPPPVATALDPNATPSALEQKVRGLLESKLGTDGELILKLSGDMPDGAGKAATDSGATNQRASKAAGKASSKLPSDSAKPTASAEEPSDTKDSVGLRATSASRSWQWSGSRGPSNWGRLDPEYGPCSQGMAQAPIAISKAEVVPGTMELPRFTYGLANFSIEFRGPALALNLLTNSKLQFRGVDWSLDHIQFRVPGEFFYDGQQASASIQFYHRYGNRQLIFVVPVAVRDGQVSSDGLRHVLQRVPLDQTDKVATKDLEWSPKTLLPESIASALTYTGSLSHPPCTEGVLWVISESPLLISKQQHAELRALVPQGFRPAQAGHSRAIIRLQSNRQ
jgi:carbonic anhydrase